MIRTAARSDLAAITALLARANDAPYDVTMVAEEKCFGRGVAGEAVVRLFDEGGGVSGVSVACGRHLRLLAVDRDRRGHGIGSALLQDASPQIIAAEPGNY